MFFPHRFFRRHFKISSLSSLKGQLILRKTCIVVGNECLTIAQSDNAEPDINIARWNRPEKY